MSMWIDHSYAKQLVPQLKGYKQKSISPFLANFACPICGDSVKNKRKKRGYLFEYKNNLTYKCHNCDASMSFGNLLKHVDSSMYDRYVLENYKDGAKHHGMKEEPDFSVKFPEKHVPETVKYMPNILEGLQSIDELDEDHPVRAYIEKRQIPEEFWMRMYYAPKFMTWASMNTDKFHVTEKTKDHPRLVIPWYSDHGVLFAYTARSFAKEEPRYYSITLDSSIPKFYGEERLDVNKPIYVVEGPIDSMFLPNAVAVGTSAIGNFQNRTANVTYIPDRDVRNKEIMKIVRKLISDGRKVCLLPLNLKGKDINEMWLNNFLTKDRLMDIIIKHTYHGLQAEMEFTKWSKV